MEVQCTAFHKPLKSIEIHGFEGDAKPKPSEAPLEGGQLQFFSGVVHMAGNISAHKEPVEQFENN